MKSGVKFVNPPYDATRAPDSALLFSTEFKSMKIIAQGKKTVYVSEVLGTATVFTHNLGYFPAFAGFTIFENKSFYSWGSFGNPAENGAIIGELQMTDTELRVAVETYSGMPETAITVYFYIFDTNLEQTIEPNNNNTFLSSIQSNKSDNKMELAKIDYDVADEKLKNKNFSSNAPSFVIHQQFYGTHHQGDDVPLRLPHNLGYFPLTFAYIRQYDWVSEPDDTIRDYFSMFQVSWGGFDYLGLDVAKNDIFMTLFSTFDYSAIVLKGRIYE